MSRSIKIREIQTSIPSTVIRITIDHMSRYGYTLTAARVDTTKDGIEQIPLGSMSFQPVAPAPRFNARELERQSRLHADSEQLRAVVAKVAAREKLTVIDPVTTPSLSAPSAANELPALCETTSMTP